MILLGLLMLYADDIGGTLLGFLVLAVIGVAYFAPTITGLLRHKADMGAVLVVNFFLGWTFVGWVVALALACSGESVEQRAWRYPVMAVSSSR